MPRMYKIENIVQRPSMRIWYQFICNSFINRYSLVMIRKENLSYKIDFFSRDHCRGIPVLPLQFVLAFVAVTYNYNN